MELTIEQALHQGITAHKEGKLQDAERLYRAILRSQPLHPDANHNLGVLAVSENKVDAALPLFKTALKANPKKEQFWFSYIDALIKEQKFKAAKQVIEQVKRKGMAVEKLIVFEKQLQSNLSPSSYNPQREFGNSLHSPQGALSPAVEKKRKKATKQNLKANDPSQQQLSSLLNYYQNGRFNEAEKLAVSITDEFPKHPFGWKVLGAVLKQTGRIAESLTSMKKSTQLAPQDGEAHFNLGITQQELGRLDEAEASYNQAIVLKPNYAEAHSNLGNTLKELGKLDEAKASYTKAITLKPDYAEAHSNLGNTLKELGKLDEAEASYTKAITLKPDLAEAHSNLGNTLKDLGKLDEAEAKHTKALALKPDYAEAHFNLGNTLKELGKLDQAKASYARAITLKSDYAEAHSNLGNTLKDLGRIDEAETSYNQAIVLKPNYAEAHSNLGNTLKELGRLDEAEASYTKAITLKPDYAEALYNRSLLLFDKADHEAALRDADACVSKKARSLALTSLYALGRIDEIYKRIEIQSKLDGEDLLIAAFAAFISESEKRPTAYNFCPNPIDFIYTANLSSHVKDSVAYLEDVIEELDKIETIWEPSGKSTISGFQSRADINLFKNPTGKIAQLKSFIINEIEAYYLKFKNEQCSYIKKFPSTRNLRGWTVILKRQGHQGSHIHPGGWLSGVIYLKVVPSLGKDEGSIEFSLNGEGYQNNNSPCLIFQPEEGDIVFFPSSLHHKTIPFTTDTDRIIVSFDLIPEATGLT